MSDLAQLRNHALTRAGDSDVPASEAALWLQIAGEIDAYLAHDPDVVLTGPSELDEPLDWSGFQ